MLPSSLVSRSPVPLYVASAWWSCKYPHAIFCIQLESKLCFNFIASKQKHLIALWTSPKSIAPKNRFAPAFALLTHDRTVMLAVDLLAFSAVFIDWHPYSDLLSRPWLPYHSLLPSMLYSCMTVLPCGNLLYFHTRFQPYFFLSNHCQPTFTSLKSNEGVPSM